MLNENRILSSHEQKKKKEDTKEREIRLTGILLRMNDWDWITSWTSMGEEGRNGMHKDH